MAPHREVAILIGPGPVHSSGDSTQTRLHKATRASPKREPVPDLNPELSCAAAHWNPCRLAPAMRGWNQNQKPPEAAIMVNEPLVSSAPPKAPPNWSPRPRIFSFLSPAVSCDSTGARNKLKCPPTAQRRSGVVIIRAPSISSLGRAWSGKTLPFAIVIEAVSVAASISTTSAEGVWRKSLVFSLPGAHNMQ